jgi:hypothetical protein
LGSAVRVPALKDAADPLDIEPCHGSARALPKTSAAGDGGRRGRSDMKIRRVSPGNVGQLDRPREGFSHPRKLGRLASAGIIIALSLGLWALVAAVIGLI